MDRAPPRAPLLISASGLGSAFAAGRRHDQSDFALEAAAPAMATRSSPGGRAVPPGGAWSARGQCTPRAARARFQWRPECRRCAAEFRRRSESPGPDLSSASRRRRSPVRDGRNPANRNRSVGRPDKARAIERRRGAGDHVDRAGCARSPLARAGSPDRRPAACPHRW